MLVQTGIAILLLAAGRSSRMRGADKLLQDVGGQSLLRRQALAALATGAPVLVALRPGDADRAAVLEGLDVRQVQVADADAGMSASIRAGVRAAAADASIEGVAILPADMPELDRADLSAVIRVFGDAGGTRILRGAGADGTPGHPVIFPRRLFADLAALKGDTGARAILRAEPALPCRLPDRHALTDLDTPEDWAEWRARTGL